MPYFPYNYSHYNHTTENRVGLALSTPLAWSNANVKLGQPGISHLDVRTDDIVTPWLGVKPHFQFQLVLNPQTEIRVLDVANMATA